MEIIFMCLLSSLILCQIVIIWLKFFRNVHFDTKRVHLRIEDVDVTLIPVGTKVYVFTEYALEIGTVFGINVQCTFESTPYIEYTIMKENKMYKTISAEIIFTSKEDAIDYIQSKNV